MGNFIQTAIIKNCNEEKIKDVLKEIQNIDSEKSLISDLDYKECKYNQVNDDLLVLFNNDCIGYEELAKNISEKIDNPILLLYIYDDDYWGYFLYENKKEIDCFNKYPDYFEEVSEEQKEKCRGNAEIIANYFNVKKEDIENYLQFIEEDDDEDDEVKAYEDDEFEDYDCWQMTDFMKKLGFPFEFELDF